MKPSTPRGSRRGVSPDPLLRSNSGVASLLAEAREDVARASLQNPSRPFTPATGSRGLFNNAAEYENRPGTAYTMSSSTFLGGDAASVSTLPRQLNPLPPTPRGGASSSAASTLDPPRSSRRPPPQPVAPPAAAYEDTIGGEAVDFGDEEDEDAGAIDMGISDAQLVGQLESAPSLLARTNSLMDVAPEPEAPSAEPSPRESAPPAKPAPAEPSETPEQAAFRVKWRDMSDLLATLTPETPLLTLVTNVDRVDALAAEMALGGDHKNERNRILRTLFKLVDIQDGELLVKICRVALTLANPGGASMLNTGKLLFKLSKNESYDSLFLQERILEPLLRALNDRRNHNFDFLIFGIGTLKNVSTQETNKKALAKKGAVKVMNKVLKWDGDGPTDEKKAQLLVQVTATLRNLATINSTRRHFVELGVIQSLFPVIENFASHGELQLNVARILSKLSLYEDCCLEIARDAANTGHMFNLLTIHGRNAPLVIRVCFALGNVTSKLDEHRNVIVDEYDGIDVLLGLLYDYSLIDEENCNRIALGEESPEAVPVDAKVNRQLQYALRETEDVLTKLIRLIAHLSINERIGPIFARDEGILPLVQLLERKSMADSEELVLNVVSAVTNLSFYYNEENQILMNQKRLAKLLTPLLLDENEEAIVEAARSFGNFSRNPNVRAYMNAKRVNEMLVILLDHSNREIVFSVCGALMNLAGDKAHKSPCIAAGIVGKLADCMRQYALADPDVVIVCLKTLYNLCLDAETSIFAADEHYTVLSFVHDLTTSAPGKNADGLLDELIQVAEAVLIAVEAQKDLPARSEYEPLDAPADDDE